MNFDHTFQMRLPKETTSEKMLTTNAQSAVVMDQALKSSLC